MTTLKTSSWFSRVFPCLVLACASTFVAAGSLQAAVITIGFQYTGGQGYTAAGSFSYDPLTTPAILTEQGGGATQHLQTFTIAFFDQAKTLLESGSSVVNGISSDAFFRLTYDTAARTISVFDGDIGGTSYKYFLTNLRAPDGTVVPAGATTFNFFSRASANTALDTAPAIQVLGQIPEPSTSVLVAGALGGLFATVRRRLSRT